jgi:hypothetical protein
MMRRSLACFFLFVPVLAGIAAAQTPPAVPSGAQAQVGALDDALRARLLTANDPRSNWMAGQLDRGDIESQVRHFAAARVAEPLDRLYLATLAMSCAEPVQPRPPECDAVDRLADWATRDPDNALPSLLLAERSRRHGNEAAMLAHLDHAAAQPRFDDYWGAGSLIIWDTVRALPVAADDSSRLALAAGLDAARVVIWPNRARALCLPKGEAADTDVRAACARIGQLMRAQGTTWAARSLGARLASHNAATPEAKASAERDVAALRGEVASCGEAIAAGIAGANSPDPALRARAVAAYGAWVQREAAMGEPLACGESAAKAK